MASELITQNLQLWRQKSRDGTLTLEESRDIIRAIRVERVGASGTSDASRAKKATTAAKAKKAPVNSADLLSELEGL